MPKAFDLEQARELVKKIGLEPLFDTYLGSQKKHLCKCPCGESFPLLFSTINRRLNEDPTYQMRCKKCNDSNKDTKYTVERVMELFTSHKAKPLFSKEFWEEKSRVLVHKEFGRLHLEYQCLCGKKDWTILENLIARVNKNPDYVLGCQSCCLKQGKQHTGKITQMKQWVLDYFSRYGMKVENFEEVEKNTSKIVFYCECGNIHQTTWMSLQQCQNRPMCLDCQIKNKPRGENHPNWNPNFTEEERKRANGDRPLAVKVWSELLRIIYEFKCQISKKVCNNLHGHHIYPRKFYPDKQFDLTNGIPLQRELHEEFHLRHGKHSDSSLDFFSFFREKTEQDWKIPQGILPVLIDNNSSDLLNMKKSFALREIEFVPIFLSEAVIKTNVIASMIKSRFGLITNKLNARDLIVREIYDTKKVSFFLAQNHRQGEVPSVVNIGLETQEGGLVSLMTFGEPRFSKEAKFELLRFCSKINTVVHGAAQKIFSYFIDKFKPESILSYADLRYSSLNPEKTIYSNLGFKHSHISTPNYWYTKDFITLEYRQKYQKHKLEGLLSFFDPSLSEEENMKNNGFHKLEDCGNHVFIWKK